MKTVAYLACVALVALTSCTEPTSATNLNPEGPPMIRQVRLSDNYQDALGTPQEGTIFAFGTHPAAVDADGNIDTDKVHTSMAASALGNKLRIIMDEILIGNSLEELECRGVVDDDVFDRVPLGATPDDIARCAAPRDVLPNTCKGENRVCVCHKPEGCMVNGTMFAQDVALGILDADEDGAADNTRFIQNSVGISCGGIAVPIDLDRSYWTPSGDQNVPAQGGFDVLGPAIVLAPIGALPTNKECGLTFAPDISDKQGNAVCAPPNGDITEPCADGDVSAFKFKVQSLTLTSQTMNNAMGVSRTQSIVITSNVPVAPDSPMKVTMTENGAAITQGAAVGQYGVTLVNEGRAFIIKAADPLGWKANTTYVITLPITITDAAGSPLLMPLVLTFKTA